MKKRLKGLVALCVMMCMVMGMSMTAFAETGSYSIPAEKDAFMNEPIINVDEKTKVFYPGDVIKADYLSGGNPFVVCDADGKWLMNQAKGDVYKYKTYEDNEYQDPNPYEKVEGLKCHHDYNPYTIGANSKYYEGWMLTKWSVHDTYMNDQSNAIKVLQFEEVPVDYYFEYDANGGTELAELDPVDFNVETPSVTLGDGTGYTNGDKEFAGWNTKADGSGTAYVVGAKVDVTTDLLDLAAADQDNTIVLYAQWKDKVQEPTDDPVTPEQPDKTDDPVTPE